MVYFLIFCEAVIFIFEILFVVTVVWTGITIVNSCYNNEKRLDALEAQVRELTE